MWKTSFKANSMILIAIGMLCLAILVASAQQLKNQSPIGRVVAKKPLLILKKNQPDSPLTITSETVDNFSDPRMPTVNFNVVNNSGKRIMVYAIKHEAVLSRGTVTGSVIVNSPDRRHALHPGKAPEVEISGIQYPEPPESLTLSVDFVEFVDGTRWGDDTLNNSERLDGLRAGANAEREALMKVLRANGPKDVIHSLDSITPEIDRSSSRSVQWLDGFRHGVGWMRERVRSKSHSYGEIEKELRRPVDSAEYRR